MMTSTRSIEIGTATLPEAAARLVVLPQSSAPVTALALAEAPYRADLHQEMVEAFASFMELDVANGEATADTISGYFAVVRRWLAWCREQGIHPGEITPDDVKRFRQQMKNEGKAIATRKVALSVIRRFYQAAVEKELLARNPAQRVRAGSDPTAPEDKMKALSESGLRALLATIGADSEEATTAERLRIKRDRALIGLMAIHGLRRIEAWRLDHENLTGEEGAPVLTVLGKGNKVRRVYLRPDTALAWHDYCAAKTNHGIPVEGAFAVVHGNNHTGMRMSRRALNNLVDKYLNESNLKRAGVSCHALRHTFGTLSVAGGAKIEHLRDAMGHTKIETTSVYVRAVEKAKNNPAHFIGPGLYDE